MRVERTTAIRASAIGSIMAAVAVLDTQAVKNRKQARSRYGAKKG